MTGSGGPDPAIFGEGPARDDRFAVVDQWADCINLPDDDPEHEIEFYHRQMNEELNVLENCARNLVEFPKVEWGIRKGMARQCADEARHAATYKRAYEERGGRIGQYPVMNFQYKILGRISSLAGRFAVQNRTFEADGLDAVTEAVKEARAAGDEEMAAIYEIQQADEVLHVRYANDWIHKQAAEDPDLGSAVGVDYLMLAGNVVGAWLMAQAALAAQKRIDSGDGDPYLKHKISTGVFFAERVLPRSEALAAMVMSGSASTMAIGADEF